MFSVWQRYALLLWVKTLRLLRASHCALCAAALFSFSLFAASLFIDFWHLVIYELWDVYI